MTTQKEKFFQTFQSLAEDCWLLEYEPEEMLKITDVLIQDLKFKNCETKCLKTCSDFANDFHKTELFELLENLAFGDFFNEFSPDENSYVMDMLPKLKNKWCYTRFITKTVFDLTLKGFLKNLLPAQAFKAINILYRCICDDCQTNLAKINAVKALREFVSKDLLKKLEPSKVLLLTNILNECSENDYAKPWVAKSIGKMGEKHLLKDHSKEQILNLVELLFSFLGY